MGLNLKKMEKKYGKSKSEKEAIKKVKALHKKKMLEAGYNPNKRLNTFPPTIVYV